MKRPLVLIHGYSADGSDFVPMRDAFKAKEIDVSNVNIGNYVSLNNEITIKDIAEGLERAFQHHEALKDPNVEFDAIVHSTGMLVLRSWLTSYGAVASSNSRLKRLKHLIGVAPATWGSPQAHKGRTWLGTLVKGNKKFGPDFLNAGDKVLKGLELGSPFTWDLAEIDLLGKEPYYGRGGATPYVAVFIGNQPYDGLPSVANDPGTDGTVRWAGCGLNTRKITIDLTKTPTGPDGQPIERASITPWANNRLDIPLIAVDGKNHGTLIAEPDPQMVNLIVDYLDVDTAEKHDEWLKRANENSQPAMKKMLVNPGKAAGGIGAEIHKFWGHLFGHKPDEVLEGWQQFVVHAVDEHGDGITDYLIEVLTRDAQGAWTTFEDMYTDVHTYGPDQSYRCFHVRLHEGTSEGRVPIRVKIHASTGTELMAYQGYGTAEKSLTANSEPVELDISDLGNGNGTLFHPFTTTLIQIVLNRTPNPLNEVSRIFGFIKD